MKHFLLLLPAALLFFSCEQQNPSPEAIIAAQFPKTPRQNDSLQQFISLADSLFTDSAGKPLENASFWSGKVNDTSLCSTYRGELLLTLIKRHAHDSMSLQEFAEILGYPQWADSNQLFRPFRGNVFRPGILPRTNVYYNWSAFEAENNTNYNIGFSLDHFVDAVNLAKLLRDKNAIVFVNDSNGRGRPHPAAFFHVTNIEASAWPDHNR